jgi:hypothetical protein
MVYSHLQLPLCDTPMFIAAGRDPCFLARVATRYMEPALCEGSSQDQNLLGDSGALLEG